MEALVKLLSAKSRGLFVDEKRSLEECTAAIAEELLASSLFHERVADLRNPAVSPCAKDDAEAERLKLDGNSAFKKGAFNEALDLYSRGLRSASAGPSAAVLFSNRAACLQKLSLLPEAVEDCSLSISCDKGFAKAWYRRGVLLDSLGRPAAAARSLREAIRLKGGACADWQKELAAVERRAAAQPTAQEAPCTAPAYGAEDPPPATVPSAQPPSDSPSEDQAAAAPHNRPVPSDTSRGPTTAPSSRSGGRAGGHESGFESNPALPAAAASVEMETDASAGRGLVVRAAVRPGEVLLREGPFAAIVHKPARTLRCHACFARLPRAPVPCSGCSAALFCSAGCLRFALLGDDAVTNPRACSGEPDRSSDTLSGAGDRETSGGAGDQPCASAAADHADSDGDGAVWARITPSAEPLPGVSPPSERADVGRPSAAHNYHHRAPRGEHAAECGGAAWPAALPTEAVLASRVALRVARERESAGDPAAGYSLTGGESAKDDNILPEGSRDFRAVERLASHWPSVDRRDKAQWLVLSVVLAECLRDVPSAAPLFQGGVVAAAQQIARATAWLRANSFAVTDDFAEASWMGPRFEQIRVAQALYPTASLVNHACAPSAHASFRGREITVRATRALEPGGKVLIAYGPQAGQQTAAVRQRLLETSHAFVCRCSACEHGAAADAELEGLRCAVSADCDGAVPFEGDGPCTACGKRPAPSERTAARAAAKAAADTVARILEVGGPFAKDTETLRRAVDSLCAASHARSQRLAEAHDALAHAMCDSAAAAAALPHLRLALAALRAHYPEGSVVLAHEAAKAAGVAAAAGEDAFAGRLAKEALAAFESHYGPGFPRSRDPELLRAAAAGEE